MEIMEAAMALFAENGFHQTTVQMIAERADFSVGYLYKHFESKEQIYLGVLDFHHEQLDKVIAEVRSENLAPLQDIYQTYRTVSDHFNKYRDFLRIYHNEIEVGCENKPRKKEEHRVYLTQALARAVDAGELKDVDVEILANAIMGAAQELFKILARREGENPLSPLADTIFELLIDPQRNS